MRTALARGGSVRAVAASLGVSPGTVKRTLARIVDRTRTADEFAAALARPLRAPVRQQPGAYAWDLETIRAARDAQMRGDFSEPVRLAEAMRTDDALFTAYHNRVAPQSAVQTKLTSHASVRGEAVKRKAAASCFVARSVLKGINGSLANHGIAIGYVEHEPNDEGTRVDMRLTEWPLEHVKWNSSAEVLETAIRSGMREPIVHGDGRWIVFRKFNILPWTQEAAILPGALLWAIHANGLKDWAGSSTSHGLAKMIAELPPGVALQSAPGVLSPQARAVLDMLQAVMSGESGVGIRPAGSKTDFVSNASSAWQVFSEMIVGREKAAARIYLGTDAMLGSVGGAPGIDIAELFGVASTIIQGDFDAIEQGLNTGLYQPWTAVNDGDSFYAPTFAYQMPDPDAEAKSKEQGDRRERLLVTIDNMKKHGFVVDQDTVNALCEKYYIDDPPVLASSDTRAVPITLAPTDVAKIIRVGPALRSLGLQPFGDARDDMTITELDEANKAKAEASKAKAEAQAQGAAQIKVDNANPEPAA